MFSNNHFRSKHFASPYFKEAIGTEIAGGCAHAQVHQLYNANVNYFVKNAVNVNIKTLINVNTVLVTNKILVEPRIAYRVVVQMEQCTTELKVLACGNH